LRNRSRSRIVRLLALHGERFTTSASPHGEAFFVAVDGLAAHVSDRAQL
jgi:hypothetical protein